MILQALDPENYYLNGYAFPMLAVGTAIFVFGFFFLVRERLSRIWVMFFFTCLSISIYLCATGVNYACRDFGLSLFWLRISQVGSVFIPSTIYMFTTAYLGQVYRSRFMAAASLVLSALLALGVLFTDLHVKGSTTFFWGRFVRYGPFGFVFIGFFLSIMVLILKLSWQEYQHSKTNLHKKRIKGLFIAFVVGYAGSIDFLAAAGIPVYPFGYIPIFFFVMMSIYVSLRYGLVDITPALAANQILETMQGAVIVTDLEGSVQVANRLALKMLGYRKSEFLGKRLASLIPVSADMSADQIRPYSSGNEVVWLGRNGRRYDVSVYVSPLVGRSGVMVGTVYVAHDITEQTRMKEYLEEQKKFTENLIENTAIATFVLDAHHKIVIWNKACEELTGVTASEMIGTDNQWKPFYDKKRPTLADMVIDGNVDRLAELYSVYTKSMLSPNAVQSEGWRPHLNGKDRYILFDAAPIYDRKGVLTAAIQTIQDITERKIAEEAISRHSYTQAAINSLLRLSLENVPIEDILNRALDIILSIPWLAVQSRGAIFLTDDSGYLILKTQRNLEERIQEACKRVPVGRCICGRAATSRKIEYVDRIDAQHEVRYDGIKPHGHYCVPIIFAERTVGVVNVYLSEGHKNNEEEQELLAAIANTLAGIIARRQAEESLIESEKKLKAITDTAGDAIILVDDEEKILYWNSSAERMLGYQTEEVMGKNVMFIIPPRYREAHIAAFRKFAESGRGSLRGKTYEGSAVKKDGMEIPVELAVSGIQLKGKWHAAGIIRDISERKKLEKQLVQAQKMEAIGTLAGGVAHDFNNIISAIIGYGHLTLMKIGEDDPLRANIDQILEASKRATVLTRSLLAFSRKQPVNLAVLDLNSLVQHFEMLLKRLLREDIDLKITCPIGPLNILADGGQLENVIMNLVTNARDAMPDGGRLTIETSPVVIQKDFIESHGYGLPGEYALLAISDTGIGMDEKTKRKIFEPFFTTKEVGRGTGLGMAMVYGIVKQHQGYINIYSEVGVGTTVKIYLPVAVAATAVEEKKVEPVASVRGGTETVLVAEDDKALRRMSTTVLKDYGYTVIEAVDGQDALIKYMEHRDKIRLVIFDGIMPKKNGWQAYEEIRLMTPSVKVIFMSGYSEDIFSASKILTQGLTYLQKPVTPSEMVKKVREVLDK